MKLNYECMKSILTYLEDELKFTHPDSLDNTAFDRNRVYFNSIVEKLSESYDIPAIKYSYKMLEDIEYISSSYDQASHKYYVVAIKYDGHKFLDDVN